MASPSASHDRDPTRDEAAPSTARLLDYGRDLQREGEAMLEAAEGAARELSGLARGRLESRPFGTLGIAFGAGLVLGGGLPVRVVSLGARAALGALLRDLLAAALDAPLASGDPGEG
jgi:hypothetical protein